MKTARKRDVTRRRVAWLSGTVAAGALLSAALPAAAAPGRASAAPAACQVKGPGGPVFITGDCVDPQLNKPYVDVKRPGTITDPSSGLTVSFTYVHGGFTGTNTKFAFYFPAKDKYKGRFFQTTYPTLGDENAAPGCPEVGTSACSVVFALSNGAYVVSTNNNGGIQSGGLLAAFRSNAAAAKYSRVVAAQVYATKARPRGYIYGASGGGYQTVGSMENTSGVWDGAVPMVFGVPNAIPSFFTVQLLALRLLGDKAAEVADAVAPGGSGDPYAGLNEEQRSVFKEATRLGVPLTAWWQYASLNGGGLAATEGIVRAIDPTYAEDFWSQPGYEGEEAAVQAARIRFDTTVSAVDGDKGLTLANVPPGALMNADLEITAGPKKGQTLQIGQATGNKLEVGKTEGITPGTAVRIDNSWLIAFQYYQRHQIPPGHEYGWDQYLDANGAPRYPQRKVVVGPFLNANTAGAAADGRFHGKMIMAESTMDILAYPWSGDWYRKQVQAASGTNQSDSFRLWYMDHANHGPDLSGYAAGIGFDRLKEAREHNVGYLGEVQQALLDLDAWVTKGAPPAATTGYRIDADTQVQLASSAAGRHGIQPVVTLTAKAGASAAAGPRVEVAAGQPVNLSMAAETPPGSGKIVRTEWDFEGSGDFTAGAAKAPVGQMVRVAETHAFAKPGVYFPVVRVTSQRNGDTHTPFGLIQNLASVRVVVR